MGSSAYYAGVEPTNQDALVGALQALGLPFVPRGYPQIVEVASPAVGATWSHTITSEGWLAVLTVQAQLVASAVVANRVPRIEYQDGEGISFARFAPSQATAASETRVYTWSFGYGAVNTVTLLAQGASIASMPLRPGYRIACVTSGLDAGDQFSNIRIYGNRYYEVPEG